MKMLGTLVVKFEAPKEDKPGRGSSII